MKIPVRGGATLEQFQDAFAGALFAAEVDTVPMEHLGELTTQPGFAVYRNTVLKNCIDALAANYPAVERIVGEAWFRAACTIFARTFPPGRPMLVDYGAGFSAFLAEFEPARELPYLADVARLDRYWTESHVASDAVAVTAGTIAALAPEQLAQLRLRPHPTARWLWSDHYPIRAIWACNRDRGARDDLADLDWRGEGVLLVRPEGSVESYRLDRAGCAFLDSCATGEGLADAALAALAADADVDLRLLMAELLRAGAFAKPGPRWWSVVDEAPRHTTEVESP